MSYKPKQIKIIRAILALNPKQLDDLARGLAWACSSLPPEMNRAEKLEFALNAHIRDQNAKAAGYRQFLGELIKEAA